MLVMPEVGCRISFGCGDCATDCAGCTCFHFAWLCELLNNIYGPMYRSVHVLRVVATHNPYIPRQLRNININSNTLL